MRHVSTKQLHILQGILVCTTIYWIGHAVVRLLF